MIKKFFVVALLVTAFTTAKTYAQEQQPQPQQKHHHEGIFQKLDTDKDGKISKTEADKQEKGRFSLKEKFDVIDANKDSFVDKEELKAYRKSQKEKRAAGDSSSKS